MFWVKANEMKYQRRSMFAALQHHTGSSNQSSKETKGIKGRQIGRRGNIGVCQRRDCLHRKI